MNFFFTGYFISYTPLIETCPNETSCSKRIDLFGKKGCDKPGKYFCI
jgi:hypothetical protein